MSLDTGHLIHIQGETIKPEEVQITAGQTVLWAVDGSPDITTAETSSRLN